MVSRSSFVGGEGGPNGFVRKQVEALEANRSAYVMYNFLRANGFSVDDIVAVSRSQKKGRLVGADEFDASNANRRVTLHHNYYPNVQDRAPATELAFSWDGFAMTPYAYAAHDPSQLPSL